MKRTDPTRGLHWLLLLALALSLGPAACRPRARNRSSRLILFAASSLTDAMDELSADFEADHPGLAIQPSYASSGQLAVQLSQGIEADIFASADLDQMETVQQAGHIKGPVQLFASNDLVVLIPRGNPAGIQRLSDLAQPGLRLLVATPDAPLRIYTEALLARIGEDSAEGQQLRRRIMGNVVSEEDNARQVVAKIALGEADAAFGYRSDAASGLGQQVSYLELPLELRIQAAYAIAVVEGSSNAEGARQFIAYVLSPEGQTTLRSWGFGGAPQDE